MEQRRLDEEEEEAEREWHPSRGNLNTELAVQYELAQEQQRLEEEMEAAARGLRRCSRQRGPDTEQVGCSEGVSVDVECKACGEAALIARGEMVVPRLRSRQRATQEQTAAEVHREANRPPSPSFCIRIWPVRIPC